MTTDRFKLARRIGEFGDEVADEYEDVARVMGLLAASTALELESVMVDILTPLAEMLVAGITAAKEESDG